MKKKERAVVLSQECIATDIYSMWIETPDIAAEAIPGQFITLYTKDADKLLPRPISLCEIDKKKWTSAHRISNCRSRNKGVFCL